MQGLVVRAEGPSDPYPMRLPGAYALYDARNIDTTIGGGVEIWPDRIGGRDALTGPNYMPTMTTKEGRPCVGFDGTQWMFAGGGEDWSFLSGTSWTMAATFWIDIDADPSWQSVMGTASTNQSGGRSFYSNVLYSTPETNRLQVYGEVYTGPPDWQYSRDLNLHTAVVTADDSGVVRCFLDGVKQSEYVVFQGNPNTNPLYIGSPTHTPYALCGGITNAYIGTEPLTDAQAIGYHNWSLGSG